MDRVYTFWGKVQAGAKRGRALGFPTANIPLHKQIPEGVYISEITIKNKIYPAATFIGSAKTFGEKDYKSETYILDFNQNIYGEWISIKLVKKIRGNKKFAGEKDLVEQMKKDSKEVKNYFEKS